MIIIDNDGKVREEKFDGTFECICKAGRFDGTYDSVPLRHNVAMLFGPARLFPNWKATYLRLNKMMLNPQDYDWRVERIGFSPMTFGDVVLLGLDDSGNIAEDLDDAQREIYLEQLGESVE